MGRPATALAREFLSSGSGVLSYLARLEARHSEGVLSAHDVTRAYEGAFLSYYTSLERHLERLFYGLLMGRYTISGHSSPRVTIASERVAREVVAGDRRYVDWLPIVKTERRAPIFLSGGRPFDRLEPVGCQGGPRADALDSERCRTPKRARGTHLPTTAHRWERNSAEAAYPCGISSWAARSRPNAA